MRGTLSPKGVLRGRLSHGRMSGKLTVPKIINADWYDGEYTVDPDFTEKVLETKEKTMRDDVTVNPIYVSYTENPSGGNTVYIGGTYHGESV